VLLAAACRGTRPFTSPARPRRAIRSVSASPRIHAASRRAPVYAGFHATTIDRVCQKRVTTPWEPHRSVLTIGLVGRVMPWS